MKATFLCTSLLAMLPFSVLRELRPVDSCSWRGRPAGRSGTVSSLPSGGVGVGVGDGEGSLRGLCAGASWSAISSGTTSGSGLKDV